MMRRGLALLLLAAHVTAAAHLMLEAHAASEQGGVVEAQPSCPRPHGAPGVSHGHVRAGGEACPAAALLGAGGLSPRHVTVDSARAPRLAAVDAARGESPLEVLDVAPKGSPPARLQ